MLPAFDGKTHIIVPVVPFEYGKDAVTDEPLVKYGTLDPISDDLFYKGWFDSPERAEKSRQSAQDIIDKLTKLVEDDWDCEAGAAGDCPTCEHLRSGTCDGYAANKSPL
jgi:hypothetical protein